MLKQPDEQSLGGLRIASALNNLVENIAIKRKQGSFREPVMRRL
jgi:hypothetical protein